ncbi:uroporphyrinogen-III synthase, partial [Chryseobacterium mucoviscidosis]
MRIKSILVSQPAPSESSPYLEIAKKEKIKIDFRPFIHVEGVDNKELRTQKIDLT